MKFSDYPPGVTGNEDCLTGGIEPGSPDTVRLEEHQCAICGWAGVATLAIWHDKAEKHAQVVVQTLWVCPKCGAESLS